MKKDERDLLIARARFNLETVNLEVKVGKILNVYTLNFNMNHLADAVETLLDVVEDLAVKIDDNDSEEVQHT